MLLFVPNATSQSSVREFQFQDYININEVAQPDRELERVTEVVQTALREHQQQLREEVAKRGEPLGSGILSVVDFSPRHLTLTVTGSAQEIALVENILTQYKADPTQLGIPEPVPPSGEAPAVREVFLDQALVPEQFSGRTKPPEGLGINQEPIILPQQAWDEIFEKARADDDELTEQQPQITQPITTITQSEDSDIDFARIQKLIEADAQNQPSPMPASQQTVFNLQQQERVIEHDTPSQPDRPVTQQPTHKKDPHILDTLDWDDMGTESTVNHAQTTHSHAPTTEYWDGKSPYQGQPLPPSLDHLFAANAQRPPAQPPVAHDAPVAPRQELPTSSYWRVPDQKLLFQVQPWRGLVEILDQSQGRNFYVNYPVHEHDNPQKWIENWVQENYQVETVVVIPIMGPGTSSTQGTSRH